MNLTFCGERRNHVPYITLNGELLDLIPSLKFRRHSPTGFDWGYRGSGPSQLAFAIMLEVLPYWAAELMYVRFRDDVLLHLDNDKWTLTDAQISGWVSRNAEHMVRACYVEFSEPPVDVVEEVADDDSPAAEKTEGPEGRSFLRPGEF